MDFYEVDHSSDTGPIQAEDPYPDGDQHEAAHHNDPYPDYGDGPDAPHGHAEWVDTDGDGEYDKLLVDRDGDGDWDNLGPAHEGGGRHR